ncbi:MAG: uroporphyrinogen-III synthase [Pirellulales bacterium]
MEPPEDWASVDEVLKRLNQFHWLVFSSVNGVEYFWDRLRATGADARALGHIRIAAIGPATAAALEERQIRADLTPDEYRAEALAQALMDEPAGVRSGQRVLLLRASRGREILAERLCAAVALVEQVVVYRSLDVETPNPEIVERLAAGEFDWCTVTSSAIARSLVRLFGDALRHTKLASISPITTATLRELGYDIAAEATEYTMPGVTEAILRALR